EARKIKAARDHADVNGRPAKRVGQVLRVRLANGDDGRGGGGARAEIRRRLAVQVVAVNGERKRQAELRGQLAGGRRWPRGKVGVQQVRLKRAQDAAEL